MSTIREWLTGAGFDFEAGTIVYQAVTEDSYSPGWGDPASAEIMSQSVLDQEFDSSYGAPRCPRFFARCGERVFFPGQYDGSTFLVSLNIDPAYYMDPSHQTPYPGG